MADLTTLAAALQGVTGDDLRALANAVDEKAQQPSVTPPEAAASVGADVATPAEAPAETPTVWEKPEPEPEPEPAPAPEPTEPTATVTTTGATNAQDLLAQLNLAGVPDQVEKVKNWVKAHFNIEL